MSTDTTTIAGRYIYCVTRSQAAANLVATGIDDLPVSAVAVNGLAAIVSPSEVKRYRLSRQYTVAHETVIETAMALGTVLPVRFGTVAENENLIRRKLLTQRLRRPGAAPPAHGWQSGIWASRCCGTPTASMPTS